MQGLGADSRWRVSHVGSMSRVCKTLESGLSHTITIKPHKTRQPAEFGAEKLPECRTSITRQHERVGEPTRETCVTR